jgi:hypothetical protein
MDVEAVAGLTSPLFSGRETDALPPLWDADLVGERLVQAFVALERLPRVPVPSWRSACWPLPAARSACQLTEVEFEKSERQRDSNSIAIRPSAAEITKMEAAFAWLSELRVEDSGMALVVALWALRTARGRSIKKLCAEKQWASHTFFRKRAKALAWLAQTLNARGVRQ